MYSLKSRKYISPCLIMLFTVLFINGIFLCIRRYDNKYTKDFPPVSGGALLITEEWVAEHPVTPLTAGWQWELNSDTGKTAYENVWIGQYGSYSKNSMTASPYGIATYRLTLNTPKQPGGYLLYLPEIFSTCEIRVNGVTVETLGDISPSSYRPYVKNCIVAIPSGEAFLTVTAANYTHYYSGMTYPPLFGTYGAVIRFAEIQLVLYGFLCFFTLGAAVLSLAFWVSGRRENLSLLYGIMSLCFSIYISYPLSRFLGIRHIRFFYAAEDTAFYGMILCIVLISQLLTGKLGEKLHRAVSVLCLSFCVLPAVTSFLLAPVLPQWVNLSGILIQLYKLFISVYLIAVSVNGLLTHGSGRWLFTGNFVFALGTLEDFLTAGMYEPVYGLWQTEYTCFFIVLIFTAMMILRHRRMAAENEHLTHHLQDEIEKKTAYLTILLNERRQLLSGIAHDMKAPIAVIKAYIDMIRTENIHIDEEIAGYISIIDRKSSSLAKQITALQTFNSENSGLEVPALYPLSGFLRELYEEAAPYADAAGIYLQLILPDRPAYIRIQKARLLGALENILLNATEYTPPEGNITICCHIEEERAILSIRDTGCGISPENLPHIFDYGFSGTPEAGQNGIPRGIGLYFARIAVLEHGGSIFAESEPERGTVFTVILPLVKKPLV